MAIFKRGDVWYYELRIGGQTNQRMAAADGRVLLPLLGVALATAARTAARTAATSKAGLSLWRRRIALSRSAAAT